MSVIHHQRDIVDWKMRLSYILCEHRRWRQRVITPRLPTRRFWDNILRIRPLSTRQDTVGLRLCQLSYSFHVFFAIDRGPTIPHLMLIASCGPSLPTDVSHNQKARSNWTVKYPPTFSRTTPKRTTPMT